MSDMTNSQHDGPSLELNEVQRRVLGVLIEKACTTPDQYPLTLNAVVSGCNQKSNRNPVMQLAEGEITNAIQELIHKQLARYADVGPGSRANRFEHTVTRRFPWSPKEQAVLAELMIRGPQTVGEIRTRADRMSRIEDLPTAQAILDELGSNDPPYVTRMERVPGQSAVRYRHNFYSADEIPADAPSIASGSQAPPPSALTDLESRVVALEQRLAILEAQLEAQQSPNRDDRPD